MAKCTLNTRVAKLELEQKDTLLLIDQLEKIVTEGLNILRTEMTDFLVVSQVDYKFIWVPMVMGIIGGIVGSLVILYF